MSKYHKYLKKISHTYISKKLIETIIIDYDSKPFRIHMEIKSMKILFKSYQL
jgi:hypothetical protein